MVYITDDSKYEVDDFYNLNNNKNMNWSIIRMRVYYVLLVVVGGLTALQGSHIGDFSTVIGILTAIETELTN